MRLLKGLLLTAGVILTTLVNPQPVNGDTQCATEKRNMEEAMRNRQYFQGYYNEQVRKVERLQRQVTAAWDEYIRLKGEGKYDEARAAYKEWLRIGELLETAKNRARYAAARHEYWSGQFLYWQTAYQICVRRKPS